MILECRETDNEIMNEWLKLVLENKIYIILIKVNNHVDKLDCLFQPPLSNCSSHYGLAPQFLYKQYERT